MRWQGGVLLLVVMSPACTFGSLASYDIQQCDPTADEQYTGAGGATPDVCDRLNDGNMTSCNPWQCDPATSQCVQKTRDDDRDGDPPTACGGGDCDDTDPTLNSLHVAMPSLLANVSLDQGSAATFSYDGVTPVIAFVSQGSSGPCITVADADAKAMSIGPCTAGKMENYEPSQPYGVITSGGALAAAFTATSGCPVGKVGFAYVSAGGAEVDAVDPTCGSGASLPALAVSGAQAAVAFYETPALEDPLADCSAAVPADLVVTPIMNVGDPGIGPKAVLGPGAVSVRPPAILWQSPNVFVASPIGMAVTLWALEDQALSTVTAVVVPELANARGASMGVRANADGTTTVAVISELGCTPQAIHVAFLDYDPTTTSFSATGDVELSPAGTGFQATPTIVWSAARGHWLATWVAAGPLVSAQFIDDMATPSEAAFTASIGAFGGVALANAHAALLTQASGDQLFDSELRCP